MIPKNLPFYNIPWKILDSVLMTIHDHELWPSWILNLHEIVNHMTLFLHKSSASKDAQRRIIQYVLSRDSRERGVIIYYSFFSSQSMHEMMFCDQPSPAKRIMWQLMVVIVSLVVFGKLEWPSWIPNLYERVHHMTIVYTKAAHQKMRRGGLYNMYSLETLDRAE